MEIRKNIERNYYNYGKSYEDFEILYKYNNIVLVKNITTTNKNKYSFGTWSEFKSIYSFPVQQSCLIKTKCINVLQRYIKISKEYIDILPYVKDEIKMYKEMIKVLKESE